MTPALQGAHRLGGPFVPPGTGACPPERRRHRRRGPTDATLRSPSGVGAVPVGPGPSRRSARRVGHL